MRFSATVAIVAAMMFAPLASWAKGGGPALLADVPSWAEGDTWRFRTPAGGEATWTVAAVTPDAYEISRDGPGGQDTYSVPRHLPTLGGDAVWQAAGNGDARLIWLLTLNRKWLVRLPANERGAGPWQTTWKVERLERIQVPAGTFDAVRMDGKQCDISIHKCGQETMWFAAAAQNVIKVLWDEKPYSQKRSGKSIKMISFTVH